MSETRKNQLAFDGAQPKDDDNVASYKAIPESDADLRSSKSNLSKSKEKISPDGAEEKLLPKEEEAKIVTRVDMADAKYVVEDHRNGDAKIELDANKRQFSGLTKEELLKYADDPFWVNLRWVLFALFWVLWLAMLAGAITIIVRSPKCTAPEPKTWFQKGPLLETENLSSSDLELQFPLLQSSRIQGLFIEAPTYDILDTPSLIDDFKKLFAKAKEYGVKVIVDLTPNFVSRDHRWFQHSENRSQEFVDYFVWASGSGFLNNGEPKPPNAWVSLVDTEAWQYSEARGQFYLSQYGRENPDLNFRNPAVLEHFENILTAYMKAGAYGVRLNKARELLVNISEEVMASGVGSDPGVGHTDHGFWRHKHTSDLQELDQLFARWAKLVDELAPTPNAGQSVFTLREVGQRAEWYLLERGARLRPAAAAPRPVSANVTALATQLRARLDAWPLLQLRAENKEQELELAPFVMLLGAAPVLTLQQLAAPPNVSSSELLSHVVELRENEAVLNGSSVIDAVPAVNATHQMLACIRWKAARGYVALHNPGETARANLSALAPRAPLPARLVLHHVTQPVRAATGYTLNATELRDNVLVPSRSTVVLSFVPAATA